MREDNSKEVALVRKKSTVASFAKCGLLLCAFASYFTPVFADNLSNPCPWIFTGGLGYARFDNAYKSDGDTALGRLAIGKEFYQSDELAFGSEMSLGLEVGIQSGNNMRMDVPQPILDILGSLPIQSTIKPAIDALVTLRTNTLQNAPIFTQLKAGIAYRQWQFEDRDSIDTLSEVAPELQVGLGYLINERAFATLVFQEIFGGNPDFTVNATNLTGKVYNIPSQSALILGISFTI